MTPRLWPVGIEGSLVAAAVQQNGGNVDVVLIAAQHAAQFVGKV